MPDCLRPLSAIVAGSNTAIVVTGAAGLSVTFIILQKLLLAGYLIEVPTAKWSELRYGLIGQLEDHDGEASQA